MERSDSADIVFGPELSVKRREPVFVAGYAVVGYKVLLPGSAVPGWPAEVSLPIDWEWKNEYAVRRLVRDGVDVPLARLFVHAARQVDPSSQGIDRARSATEAFFYRRLETLPETAGRFRLNAELSIPFDGWGKMEVDLLCTNARLVIERDGEQHLANADASLFRQRLIK